MKFWRKIATDVLGEKAFGIPGFGPLMVDWEIANHGMRLGTFVANTSKDYILIIQDSLN